MAIKTKVVDGKKLFTVYISTTNVHTKTRVQKFRTNIPNIQLAKQVEKELWSQCRNDIPGRDTPHTWGKLLEKYCDSISSQVRSLEKEGLSPATLTKKFSAHKHIEHWGDLPISDITKTFVVQEMDLLESEKGQSRSLTCELVKEIKTIFSFAIDSGFLNQNPIAKLKRKVPQTELQGLTKNEVDFLLYEAKKRKHPYFLVWLMSVFTGLRRSELAGLQWNEVDFDNELITVNKQWIPGEGLVLHTKSKKFRKVPLAKALAIVLKEEKLKSKSQFVIVLEDKSWRYGCQARVLREFCQEIGITPIRHHDLRATFITQMLTKKVALVDVKEIVGHSRLSTTDRYLRSCGLDLQGKTESLDFEIPSDGQAKVYKFVPRGQTG